MPKIHFLREQKVVDAPVGANLRQVARANGIDIYYRFAGMPNFVAQNVLNCHGFGFCGTCGVHLVEGTAANAKPAGMKERLRVKVYDPLTPHLPAARIGHEDEFRLSCQTTVQGDLKVVTKPYNWFGGAPAELEKIGEKNPEYDQVLAKVAPTQKKARDLGITRPVTPEEMAPKKEEKKDEKKDEKKPAAAPPAEAPKAEPAGASTRG